MYEAITYEYIVPESRVKIYEYSELSESAKDKAKQWYCDDDFRAYELTSIFKRELENKFPNSNLECQWSLCSCQGDGVNVFGEFNFYDLLRFCYQDGWKVNFTPKQMKRLEYYMSQTEITVEENRRYAYCVVQQPDYFSSDWVYDLSDHRDLDEDLLEDLSKLFASAVRSLCKSMENWGWDYLYDPDDDEVSSICDLNDWYFYEDGSYFDGIYDKLQEVV